MKSILSKKNSSILIVALCLMAHSAFAQKIENVQKENAWVSDLKVDGSPNDWQLPLKAHNKNTGISYTMANDDKNLYLMIQSDQTEKNSKILLGGISLYVNNEGKKNTDEAASITFPVTNTNFNDARKMVGFVRHQRSQDKPDSVEMAQGNAALSAYKEIGVTGIPAIKDSTLSIYNLHGIKAAASFNNKGDYYYELAVPLDLLGLSATNNGEFAYDIQLNGVNDDESNRGLGRRSRNNFDLLDMITPTDFWGKYKLSSQE